MIRKTFLASAALATALAGPAHALSCMQPDPVFSFQQAEQSDDAYTVLNGTVTFNPNDMPGRDINRSPSTPDPAPVRAHFEGFYLTQDGAFTTPISRDITLQPVCFGPWCGGLSRSGEDLLAFARIEGSAIIVDLEPCNNWHFTNVRADDLARIGACMRGEACETRN
ncbi:MAG: hypothetical protein JKX69_08785 [Rhodobacteraceae bacterium]|nr:hypothetical protein [Paracoccaceae bacterium]